MIISYYFLENAYRACSHDLLHCVKDHAESRLNKHQGAPAA